MQFYTGIRMEDIKITDIDTMEEDKLISFIKDNIIFITEDILVNKDTKFIEFILNDRFLINLINVLDSFEITDTIRTCSCKLAYDYVTLDKNDRHLKKLFFTLVRVVNKDKIPKFQESGKFDDDLIISLLMARYSSLNPIIGVKRVNFIIMTSDVDLMKEDIIINIYKIIFDRMTPLFLGMMFDIFDDEEEWVTDDVVEINGWITMACLSLLNDMSYSDIKTVLLAYHEEFSTNYDSNLQLCRFPLNSLSRDFEKIRGVFRDIRSTGIDII